MAHTVGSKVFDLIIIAVDPWGGHLKLTTSRQDRTEHTCPPSWLSFSFSSANFDGNYTCNFPQISQAKKNDIKMYRGAESWCGGLAILLSLLLKLLTILLWYMTHWARMKKKSSIALGALFASKVELNVFQKFEQGWVKKKF